MTHRRLLAAMCIGCLLSISGATSAAVNAPPIKLTQKQDRVAVEIGGKPFTDYYFAGSDDNPYVRPYAYPVHAPDGTVVTMDKPADHVHHRSFWVSHGDVNGADHWSLKGKGLPKQRHVRFQKVEGDTIVQDLEWEDTQNQPILRETRTLRFFSYPDGNRGVDLTCSFTAVDKPVTFGDTKEAGLCFVRVPKAMSATSTLTLSSGIVSTKQAEEKLVWGKPADWGDLSGKIDGKTYGIAIMDHPSNPRHPARWHIRHYGLMGANNPGAKDFDKTDPEAYKPLTVEAGKPTTFKYRVVIHLGDAKAAGLEEKYKEFAK